MRGREFSIAVCIVVLSNILSCKKITDLKPARQSAIPQEFQTYIQKHKSECESLVTSLPKYPSAQARLAAFMVYQLVLARVHNTAHGKIFGNLPNIPESGTPEGMNYAMKLQFIYDKFIDLEHWDDLFNGSIYTYIEDTYGVILMQTIENGLMGYRSKITSQFVYHVYEASQDNIDSKLSSLNFKHVEIPKLVKTLAKLDFKGVHILQTAFQFVTTSYLLKSIEMFLSDDFKSILEDPFFNYVKYLEHNMTEDQAQSIIDHIKIPQAQEDNHAIEVQANILKRLLDQ